MRNNPNFISEIIMGFAKEVISEMYSNDEIHTKKDDTDSSIMETEDLGYAVVVEDDNRQTKLIN
jgi:hypothetical protein